MKEMEYSFYKLICENAIEIPNLQRAYAQGRNTGKAIEIRNNFIADIKKALDNDTHLSLDTIYGEWNTEENIYIPLDGQQRLTTLFLLHWYLACSLGKDLQDYSLADGSKSRFCYATRTTSLDFCNYLVQKKFRPEDLKPFENDKKEKAGGAGAVQRLIKSAMAFQWTWENDPTVTSMLNMLDTIHEKFSPFEKERYEKYFEALTRTDNPVITFYNQKIEGAIPADELYIRMNARGLALTEFENFKASLFYFLCDNPVENESLHEAVDTIKKNLDTPWQNAMWTFCNKAEGNHYHIAREVDTKLLRLLHICILFQIMEKYFANPVGKDSDTVENLVKAFNGTKQFPYYQLTQCSYFAQMDIEDKLTLAEEICRIMNLVTDLIENQPHLDDSRHKLLKELLTDVNCSYERILRFYVRYYMFPETKDEDRNSYRILKRLIKYSYISEFIYFERALKALFALKKNCHSFWKDFQECGDPEKFLHNGFAYNQMWEEYYKIQLKTKNPDWREPIEKAEADTFFDGQILFLLECLLADDVSGEQLDIKLEKFSSEILEKANNPELLKWFREYFAFCSDLMRKDDDGEKKRCLLRKCLILKSLEKKGDRCLPDYPFTPDYVEKWSREQLYERNPGSMITESSAKDELNWKRVLRISMTKQKDDKPEYRSLIKWAVQKARTLPGNTFEKLQSVIDESLQLEFQFDDTPAGKICQVLADWCSCDWSGYYHHGIRLIEKGKIALLDGAGARLYKNFQELHMMMIKPKITAVSEDNFFGCLVIPCGETERILLEYEDGKVRGCRCKKDLYGNSLDWQYRNYNPEDPAEVLNLICQLKNSTPNDGLQLN